MGIKIESILSERTGDFDVELLKIEFEGKTFFVKEVTPYPIIRGLYVGTSFEVQDEFRQFDEVCYVSEQDDDSFTLRADHLHRSFSIEGATVAEVWEGVLELYTSE